MTLPPHRDPTAGLDGIDDDDDFPALPAPIEIDRGEQVATAASVALFGNLVWLGWLWLIAVVGNFGAIAAVDRWGELKSSSWSGGFSGWQPWVIGAAGIVCVYYFVPSLVALGATRRVAASGIALAGAALALGGATISTIGFAVESRWFRSRGAMAWLNSDHTDTAGSIGYPMIAVAVLLLLLAAFGGGWGLLATVRTVGDLGYLTIPLWAAPMALTTVLMSHRLGSMPFAFLERLRLQEAAVGIPLALVVIAVSWALAFRLTCRMRVS